MSSFDWCRKCEFPRYIEGYKNEHDYIENGWVRFLTVTTREDRNGLKPYSTVTEWMCPVCAEEIEKERQELMEIGSARQINRRGVMVDERST